MPGSALSSWHVSLIQSFQLLCEDGAVTEGWGHLGPEWGEIRQRSQCWDGAELGWVPRQGFGPGSQTLHWAQEHPNRHPCPNPELPRPSPVNHRPLKVVWSPSFRRWGNWGQERTETCPGPHSLGGQHHRSLRGSPFTRSSCPQDTLQRLCDHPLSTGEEGGCPVQGTVLVIWTELLKSFLKDMMTTIMQLRKLRLREMKGLSPLTPWLCPGVSCQV